jgi:hypothetical protein
MKIESGSITIATYCDGIARQEIVVDHRYQRGSKVWPSAARSYLIDSILGGYPISKILLRQHTDLSTRRTVKHVIDGQQRTQAIYDFFSDKFSISLRNSEYYGRRFSTLDEDQQLRFLDYGLAADTLTNAGDEEVREIFRRLNSYNVPLNKQELRHATHQGEFKWFVNDLTIIYSQALKDLGVVSEAQINRMADAEFLTDVLVALENGIQTGSPKKLDDIYTKYDKRLDKRHELQRFIDNAMSDLMSINDLLRDTRMRARHNVYTLLLAFGNARVPQTQLQQELNFDTSRMLDDAQMVRENLSALANALDEWEAEKEVTGRPLSPVGTFAEFVQASIEGTNTMKARLARFQWASRALLPERLG